jgi:predicted enzyme related to lactoylglutathione lyase
MCPNPFGHIDLRVTDMARALPFYDQLLPRLGFHRDPRFEEWKVYLGEGAHPSQPYFAFTEKPDSRPNDNRIAFWVGSSEEVDRLGAVVKSAGGRNISGPRDCPEYSSTYYAVFFDDPCGNKLEICFRED